MTLIYRTAAGVELALVLHETATGKSLLPLGHGHAERIAVLFGTAFVLDESLAICVNAIERLKRARIRRTLAKERRAKVLALELDEQERLRRALWQERG